MAQHKGEYNRRRVVAWKILKIEDEIHRVEQEATNFYLFVSENLSEGGKNGQSKDTADSRGPNYYTD